MLLKSNLFALFPGVLSQGMVGDALNESACRADDASIQHFWRSVVACNLPRGHDGRRKPVTDDW